MRSNSSRMGRFLLRGEFEAAVWSYLVDAGGDERIESSSARARLNEERDVSAALAYFPRFLGFERKLLSHLSLHPTDYVGALRKLPRTLLLLFLHAFQAEAFNHGLSKRVSGGPLVVREGDWLCPRDSYGFPDVGAAWPVSASNLVQAESQVESGSAFVAGMLVGVDAVPSVEQAHWLEQQGVSVRDFLMPSMPEIACKGKVRSLWVPVLHLGVHPTSEGARVEFELPSGSYATVALEWMLSGEVNNSGLKA